MALDLRNFDPTGSGSKGGMKIATYDAGADTLATVEAANYFDNGQLTDIMLTGDLLVVSASDGIKFYGMTVSASAGTLTLVEVIGAGERVVLSEPALDLIGANADTWTIVAPFDFTIESITTIIDGALLTANAVITADIATVAVTGGVVTVTQAGSAAGDVDTAAPSALNTGAENAVITLTVSGTQSAARFAAVYVTLKKRL